MLRRTFFQMMFMLMGCFSLLVPAKARKRTENASLSSIVIDGHYDDWNPFDQTGAITDYSYNGRAAHTAGIYMDDSHLYIHFKLHPLYSSHMPVDSYHIKINNQYDISFLFRYRTLGNGIDWGKDVYRLPVGITELGIFSTQTQSFLGTAMFRVYTTEYTMSGSDRLKLPPDEWELSIPLDTLAAQIGIEKNMIQTVSFSGDNIGHGSITYAGTPTGVLISSGAALLCAFYFFQMKRNRKQVY